MEPNQKIFAEEYMIDRNATRAYKAAYPNCKKDRSARTNGNNLLTNTDIQQYIAEETKKLHSARIMDIKEALEISTSIARGEPQTFTYRKKIDDEWETIEEKSYSPKIEERQRSLEHIFKCNGAFINKAEIMADMDLKVVVDYGEDD